MNRRSFFGRFVGALALLLGVKRASADDGIEPVCAWCNGTGFREYATTGPLDRNSALGVRSYAQHSGVFRRRGICDVCRQDERRPERVRWLTAERAYCLAEIDRLRALRAREPLRYTGLVGDPHDDVFEKIGSNGIINRSALFNSHVRSLDREIEGDRKFLP